VTHQIELSFEDGDEHLDPEFHLDVFEPTSPSFAQDEAAYEDLKRTMLGDNKDPIFS
jgi:pre-mRNA-splicing factor CWC22